MRISKKITIIMNSIIWKMKTLSHPNIKLSFLQRLSLDTHIKLLAGKTIWIGSMCQTRRCVDIIAFDGGSVHIGEGCFLNKNCSITAKESIVLGKNVSIGNNTVVVDHDHNFRKSCDNDENYISQPITIEDNVWIGANVVVLKGTYIGEGAVIAAGTVCRGKIAPYSVYTGIK